MNNGEITARIARKLSDEFADRVEILFDHGDVKQDGANRVGVIRAWFGEKLTRETLLADLDIAVLAPQSNYALMLIEIEENASNPKKILGDLFATLISEHYTFKHTRHLDVDRRTTLIVLSRGNAREQLSDFINSQLADTQLARFRVCLGTFKDETDLFNQLAKQIEIALQNRQSKIQDRK